MSKELQQYVEQALSGGVEKKQIQEVLTDSGWSGDLVRKTLDQYRGVDGNGLLIPAPKTRFHHVIRDICVYFLTIVTLCCCAYALGDLLFRIIDFVFPDPASAGRALFSKDMNWFVAQLVVTFPIFLWLARWTSKDVDKHPAKRDALVRKMMIYWILAVTALVGLGDLTTVLYNFLNGDVTLRFMLKAAVVLGVAAMPFTYYFSEMKNDDAMMKGADDD